MELIVEHRGMSYGINDLNNIVVFPIYKFDFNEKYNFINDTLKISLKVGCFMNNKLHHGLKIYNLDTQGANLKFDWGKFNFQFHDVADLSFGVGLELEELSDFSLGYKVEKYLDFGINYSLNSYSPLAKVLDIYNDIKYNNYGVFGEFDFSNNTNCYFQYELRNAPYINFRENSALILGSLLNLKYSKLSFSLNPEFRYYGWVYNYGHKNDSVKYKQKEVLNVSTNSEGKKCISKILIL